MTNLPNFITVEEMQKMLGISRAKAYELTRRDGFPAYRIGRSIRIKLDQLLVWLDGNACLH